MEQQTESSNNQLQSSSPKQTAWSLKKRLLVIGGIILGVIAVIFAGLIVYYALANKDDPTMSEAYKKALIAKPGETNGPYHERAGYPRKDLGPTIADALGADITKRDEVAKLNDGTAIIQACTVLTPADLQKAGLTQAVEAQTSRVSMKQTYIDGKGKGAIPTDDLKNVGDLNECYYPLNRLTDRVTVHVVQDFQTKGTIFNDVLSQDYTKQPNFDGLAGVEVYKLKTDLPKVGYLLHAGQTYVGLDVALLDDDHGQAKAEPLARLIAANLLRLNQNQEGQLVAKYSGSPTFKTTYLRACTMLGEEGMKTLGYEHASAYGAETIATATGVSTFSSLNDPALYVYAQNKCERNGISADKSIGGRVELTTTSYVENKGAEQHLASIRQAAKDKQDILGLGDESIVTKDQDKYHYFIRKGRLVVDVVASSEHAPFTDVSGYQSALRPFMQLTFDALPEL